MLEVVRLTKRFGPVLALDDVDLSARRGELVGFLGPNGAGKTTTMRAVMGLISIDAGAVRWDGRPIDADARRRFGYMPAERGMYPRMRVRDHVTYYARLSGRSPASAASAADEWLERLGLGDRAGDPIQNLSSGNQQRVQLALALINEPELLVLDEPFSGLDPVAVDLLSDLLRELVAGGAALLLSSHQLDLVADVCTAVVVIDRGRVALRGDVAQLRAQSPTRVVELEFTEPPTWDGAGALVGDGRRRRIEVESEAAAEEVIRAARRHGSLLAYSYSPPDLSEIFLQAVGRDSLDEPSAAGPDDTVARTP